ncbi:PDR/VanB family oxidoreductase [Gordonia metallireducens]|uniref:PDR/VanB family oxidoreductase n=1 Tax=Gordonia metallireducens TaxID=2897779 RepID=UPI001E30E789|nr:PDR/VanB family oxidoreductase [Gordonia metallireducens]
MSVSPVSERVLATPGLTVTVVSRHLAATDVVWLELAPAGDRELPSWTAGAHIEIALPDTDGSCHLVRHYSLIGLPSGRENWQIAVLREANGRGGSAAMHDLQLGDVLEVRAVRNNFPLKDATEYLFIAGGIGITPLIGLAQEADRKGLAWNLIHLVRSADRLIDVTSLLPRDSRSHVADIHGRADLEVLTASLRGGSVYACGPAPLLSDLEKLAHDAPWDLAVERFAADPKQSADVQSTDRPFDVILQRSGKRLHVPAHRSILDVVRDAGVSVDFSCQEGICSSCEIPVLAGDLDHRDHVLDEAERAANDCMMICVSRCVGNELTLDL